MNKSYKTIKSYIKKLMNQKVMDTISFIPKFCEKCGSYSSKFHQGIWCNRCPGKIVEFPEITWKDHLDKCRIYGSGGDNDLWFFLCKKFDNEDWENKDINDKITKALKELGIR